MAKGWVTTARGDNLNIDQLIIESKRPPGLKDAASQIKKRKITGQRKQLNVRGTAVSTVGVTVPDMPDEIRKKVERRTSRKTMLPPPKVAYREGGVAETYGDITGIKLKRTKAAEERHLKRLATERGEATMAAEEPEESPADEIMQELDGYDEDVEAPKPKTTRRTRKKTTT